MRRSSWSTAWLLLLSWAAVCHAFYIPGVTTRVWFPKTRVPLYVNKLYSDKSQLTYAYSELEFVCPSQGRQLDPTNKGLLSGVPVGLNLGEILRGDRITLSDFKLSMNENVKVAKLCDAELDIGAAAQAYELVEDSYRVEWILDNLPGATNFYLISDGGAKMQRYYTKGFELGKVVQDSNNQDQAPKMYLHNHFNLIIRYRAADGELGDKGGKVIVGFVVYPGSIAADSSNRDSNGLPKDTAQMNLDDGFLLDMPAINLPARAHPGFKFKVPYTYSVMFEEDTTVTWATRWEQFMIPQDKSISIHWLAIINSMILAGLLAAVVAVIFARTIQGDIKGRGDGVLEDGRSKINGRGGLLDPMDRRTKEEIEDADDAEEVTGWKLVHADVFRAPVHRNPLAALVGVGIQLVFMAIGVLILGCIGYLSPSYRGGFASAAIGLFILGGVFAGYYAGRTYKTFGGERWKVNSLMTAGLAPGLVFATLFGLNLLAWSQASSTALPFSTILAIFALWLVFQLPLVFVGAYVGYIRHGAYSMPIKPSAIPRQIPAKPWWTGSYASIFFSGLVPFVAIIIELVFMFKSVWQDKSSYYYLFGFSTCVFTLLVVTILEVTVVSTYYLLCYEDYRWQWHAFATGASSSAWIFLYCIYYYFAKLQVHGFVSAVLFFAYSALGCTIYGLLMGALGFLTAWTFVRRIFSAIKVD